MIDSDIRIVTSINGFEKLKQFVSSYINKNFNDDSIKNLLEECDLQHKNNKQCYFGWNDYRGWEEYTNKSVAAIMEGLRFLEETDYSYRFYRLGEDKDDYEEHYFDSIKEDEQDLEYPNITREFDDRYICDILSKEKADTNLNKEDFEYE